MSISKDTKQYIDEAYTTSTGKKKVMPYVRTSTPQKTNVSSTQPVPKEKRTGQEANEVWASRIEQTLRWRRARYDRDWVRYYQMYKGLHWRDIVETDPSSDQVRDRITVNLTMSTVSNFLPFLLSKRPEFKGTPRKPETNVSAMLQSAELNYQYEQRQMHKQIKESVLDCLIVGHGIAKTGYILELDESISKADGEIVYEDYVKEDAPYVKRISPFNFLIDPCASENSLETARWCGELFYKTKADVLSNDSYDASVRSKIKSGVYEPVTRKTVFGSEGDNYFLNYLSSSAYDEYLPEAEILVLCELWDKKFQQYFVFALNVPEPLLQKGWPYDYIKGFPYVKVDYIHIPDDIYPVGIPYTIDDQQFELNRVRTQEFERRRRFTSAYEALNGLEENELNRFLEGEEGTVVRVAQIGSISPIPTPPVPPDIQLVEAMIRNDMQEITGQDQLLMGGRLPSRTTAQEVNTRTNVFRLKLDEHVESIDTFVLSVGKQVLQHIKANFTSERIIQLVGEEGEFWETLDSQSIRDEIDIFMETVSSPKVDPLLDRQQKMQILQLLSQYMPMIQSGQLNIDLSQLIKWVLESFNYKDTGRFFPAALQPNVPLQETNPQMQQPTQQPNLPEQPTNQAQNELGMQSILNQSGLQIG